MPELTHPEGDLQRQENATVVLATNIPILVHGRSLPAITSNLHVIVGITRLRPLCHPERGGNLMRGCFRQVAGSHTQSPLRRSDFLFNETTRPDTLRWDRTIACAIL